MMTMKSWMSMLAVAILAMGMIGCDEAEDAADDATDAMENAADETTDAMEHAADEAVDAAEDAANAVDRQM